MPTTLSKSLPFCCLEIKSKTKNIFLLRVKTPIHLFTYSLFTFILPFDNFRRTEPKRRWGLHNHQNWAYVTKRRHCCMNHTVALHTRDCLEIKWKTINVFLLRVKTPIHLFTYSPFSAPPCLEIKRKTENILLLRVKTTIHLFTYSPFPFILPFDNFRRVEPKRRCSHHILQNWAYATKRRLASLLLQFLAWLIQQNYAIWRVWK
jgi:hypothetical protein